MIFPYRVLLAALVSISLVGPYFGHNVAFAEGIEQASETAVSDHLEGWEFQKGDWIEANVAKNTLQFVREDGLERSKAVYIGSGINNGKKISYLGMSYNPATPERTWEIRSKHQQNTAWIFGSKESKEQLFLRLYEVKGNERVFTHYGIHTTPAIDTIIDKQGGFGSWGCLITRYDLLKQIEQLYELNDGVVRVLTMRA